MKTSPADWPSPRAKGLLAAGLISLHFFSASTAAEALSYPSAPTANVVDTYHGKKVADPYRPLEDVDSARTRAWVEANQAIADEYLRSLPGRDILQSRLEEIWDQPRYGVPDTVAGWRYFTRNDGLQAQSVLYREPLSGGPREVVLDVNQLSEDGTTALKSWEVSPDGRYLAYGVTEAGEDWTQIRVRDVARGTDQTQTLGDIKFSSIAWTANGKGFFYARYPRKEGTFDNLQGQTIWYHRVGTEQATDVRVFHHPEKPKRNYWVQVDDSGRWMLVSVYDGASDRNQLWVRDLGRSGDPQLFGPRRLLVRGFASQNQPIGVLDDVLYVLSTADAPRGQIRAIDLTKPNAQWITIVEQSEDTLRDATVVGGLVVTHHLRKAVSVLKAWSPIGEPQFDLTPPGMAAISAIGGAASRREIFFRRSSPVEPSAIWRADLSTGELQPWQLPQPPVDPTQYETQQLFASSSDGTQIPYFVTHQRGMKPDTARPTWLYGYGGFNIPLQPGYRVHAPLWLDAGGIFVVANLRGGGEFGEAWHRAGTKLQKQNVFDDFIAVAEDLIKRGWTSPQQLAIHGRSNGGLLVGAVTNQRPELFAAALPGVGVMDMLRFHKFTIGWAWTGDYGSSDKAEEFRALHAYSPLHNVAAGKRYPPVLVYTADHDDRVVPGHSFKYAATLQNTDTGPNPTLIRIETQGGHGSGKPTAAQIAETRDLLLFSAFHTGLEWPAAVRSAPGLQNNRLNRLIGH